MLRKLPVFIVTFLLAVFVLSQVPAVRAQVVPLTGPVTPPVTVPVTAANVMGKVVYKQLGRLFGNMQRIVPAQGVVVTIQNFFNPNQKMTTTTDANGNYKFNVPNGFYQVNVSNADNTFFVPPLKTANIRNNTRVVDFQGLLFPNF